MFMRLLKGLIAAAHTPTNEDGSLHSSIIEKQAKLYASAGVKGVFVCGSTGEALSFTKDERREILETWCPVAKANTLFSIIHVGGACQSEAVELSEAANSVDAGAVAAMAPPFIPPASIDDLVDFLSPIAKAAGDRPFLFYDNPARSHVDFAPGLVLEALKKAIPNFAGVKLTRSDLEAAEAALDACGEEAQVFFAADEMLLFALQLGVEAAIGASYNHSAGLFSRMMKAHQAGDMAAATAEHDRAVVMIDVLHEHGIIPAGKTIMSLLGIECGPPRPPLKPLPVQAATELANALESLGLPDMSPCS
ncbi:MAG: N-acetylneuraminate lyase [Phycisphaerae bacterium]|nr:N-acetylneuraminate lyase [Phycisphaerae bacterium]|tara:strand:- start:208 stop:1128 length:921 start_codon:yes stop_codon:yes gene_type:complete